MPIYLRITVDGITKETTTTYQCEPERWNHEAQRCRGSKEESKITNVHLSNLELQIHDIRWKLIKDCEAITSEKIKNVLKGKTEKVKTLLEVFIHHNEQMKALSGTEYAPATVKRYDTTIEHIKKFIAWKYNQSDIELSKLTYNFITELEFWFKSVRKCNHNSTIKYIGNLRKIVNFCLKSSWIPKDPFFGFKMSKKEVIREFLSEEELNTIVIKTFAIERLSQVRDIFVFSCYTGLAFIDVFNLTAHNIAIGIDGSKWLFTSRQKTETPSRIPLLPPALAIIDQYAHHPKCSTEGKLLPVLSNQKMNVYLKEIADVCEISKPLTFHIARHTFATTVTLSNGVPIESVSKMLGHKDIKITQHYAKILDKKVSEDMQKLQEKFKKVG